MKEIGQILKETREAKGISYDEIYEVERIQHKYLLAIENGDTSVFTANVYYLSFAKSYAKYLGLDFDELVKKYQLEKSQQDEENKEKDGDKDKNEKSADKSQSKTSYQSKDGVFTNEFKGKMKAQRRVFAMAFVIIFSAAGIYYYSTDSQKQKIEENDDSISIEGIDNSVKRNTVDTVKPEVTAPPAISAAPILTPPQPPSSLNLPITVPSKTNLATPSPAVAPAISQTSATAISSSQLASTGASNNVITSKLSANRQSLSITAIDTVWLGIRVDGETVFEGDLPAGTQRIWEANETFRVRVGKGLAVRIVFNGSEIDPNIGMNPDSTKTLILRKQR